MLKESTETEEQPWPGERASYPSSGQRPEAGSMLGATGGTHGREKALWGKSGIATSEMPSFPTYAKGA